MLTQDGSIEHAKYECMCKNNIIVLRSDEMAPYLAYIADNYGQDFLQSCRNKAE